MIVDFSAAPAESRASRDAVRVGDHAELTLLAHERLRSLESDSSLTALNGVIKRLFDRDHRELLTVSAFGSAL